MRSRGVLLLIGLLLASLAGCSGRCIRHSDCPSGSMCRAEGCVLKAQDTAQPPDGAGPPGGPVDQGASLDAADLAGSSTADGG